MKLLLTILTLLLVAGCSSSTIKRGPTLASCDQVLEDILDKGRVISNLLNINSNIKASTLGEIKVEIKIKRSIVENMMEQNRLILSNSQRCFYNTPLEYPMRDQREFNTEASKELMSEIKVLLVIYKSAME